jgi:regulator of replication initiation timing
MTMADTPADPGGQEPAGEWLDLRTAQLRLGVGERTIRRRVADGSLQKRHRMDGRLEVLVPLTGSPPQSDSESAMDRQHEQAERSLVLIERVQVLVAQQVEPIRLELAEANRRLEDANARLQALSREAGELTADNAHLRERLAQFEQRPPQADPETAPDGQADTPSDQARPDTSRHPNHPGESPPRPWWAFWRG